MTWSGRKVTTARAYWRSRLPLPCYLCPGIVHTTDRWVVEHKVPRASGGSDDQSNQWVSHRSCSNRQGARMGAARTNAARTNARLTSDRARGIRGL